MKTILIIIILFTTSHFFCKKDELNPNTVTDIDGNIYKTITIGKHTWMAENLRVIRLRIGSYLNSMPPKSTGDILMRPSYVKFNGEYFYNTPAVNDARGLPPTGWHIPTLEEFEELKTEISKNFKLIYDFGYKTTGTYSNFSGGTGSSGGLVFYSAHTSPCTTLQNISYTLYVTNGALENVIPYCIDGTNTFTNIRCVKD